MTTWTAPGWQVEQIHLTDPSKSAGNTGFDLPPVEGWQFAITHDGYFLGYTSKIPVLQKLLGDQFAQLEKVPE